MLYSFILSKIYTAPLQSNYSEALHNSSADIKVGFQMS